MHRDSKWRGNLEYEWCTERVCALKQEGSIVEIHEWMEGMVSDHRRLVIKHSYIYTPMA